MRVVVIGGSGLIGRALVRELSGSQFNCEVLSRHPERIETLPDTVAVARWDGSSVERLADLIDGASAVVNLVGESIGDGRWTTERKEILKSSRVGVTRAVIGSFESTRTRPSILLQGSAVGIYGAQGSNEIGEHDPPGSDFLAELSIDWEAASAGVEDLGVRRVLFRTGVVLSKSGGALPRMALPFRMFAGGPVGSGDQIVSWIHIADEVGAIRFLLEQETASGPFNLTAPNPVTNREFSRSLGNSLHRPSFMPTPAFALKMALGEMSTLALDGQRAVPTRLLELGYKFRFPDIDSALQDIYC